MSFDLDAVIAERESATPFTFTFDGHEYSMPSDVDVRALELLSDSRINDAFELLIGADDWAQIVESPKVLGAAALGALVDAYLKHIGVSDMGESLASTRSLSSTVRPSKRTSNGSTKSDSRTSTAT